MCCQSIVSLLSVCCQCVVRNLFGKGPVQQSLGMGNGEKTDVGNKAQQAY